MDPREIERIVRAVVTALHPPAAAPPPAPSPRRDSRPAARAAAATSAAPAPLSFVAAVAQLAPVVGTAAELRRRLRKHFGAAGVALPKSDCQLSRVLNERQAEWAAAGLAVTRTRGDGEGVYTYEVARLAGAATPAAPRAPVPAPKSPRARRASRPPRRYGDADSMALVALAVEKAGSYGLLATATGISKSALQGYGSGQNALPPDRRRLLEAYVDPPVVAAPNGAAGAPEPGPVQ